jgi:lysine 2,3-aminomutase
MKGGHPKFLEVILSMKSNKINFLHFDKVAIDTKSQNLLKQFSSENPEVFFILNEAKTEIEALDGILFWIQSIIKDKEYLSELFEDNYKDIDVSNLSWQDYGIIRIMDYIRNAGRMFKDANLKDEMVISHPIRQLWLAIKEGKGGGSEGFFLDMLKLFQQINNKSAPLAPDLTRLEEWMNRHPSGLDKGIVAIRQKNKERIIRLVIKKIDAGTFKSTRFFFDAGMTEKEKYKLALKWWEDKNFHLKFAIRTPKLLNEFLDFSLDKETMELLNKASENGIPFFVNLYYLSLLHVGEPSFAIGSDLPIRDYVLYSKQLIEEFGEIQAWEKEDEVKSGEPNAAGWILPDGNNVHRRYPEVAILIPDTVGRACGGLCVSCQRMYDFQSGRLNFNFDKLLPKESWPVKLHRLLNYFEEDNQLNDILITGGDALMSRDKSLQIILDAVFEMAKRKKENNLLLPNGLKKAEIRRVRLGTRLPVYLPQRITAELCEVLDNFRKKASKIGIKQFVIQTHFETAMEVTPEAKKAIEFLLKTGWLISNQLVFTAAASRRGHTSKLRKVLNDLGILTYYTFSVKGYRENYHNFATNARALQEQIEEKRIGVINENLVKTLKVLIEKPEHLAKNISELRIKHNLPFLATDRNVLNMPGVGKSLTFRTIGLTRLGRRILEFDHDHSRIHSPVINEMGKIVIIESKSIKEYLDQLENMGENIEEYMSLFGYSMGVTEPLQGIWNLGNYDFETNQEMNHFKTEDQIVA